MDKRDHSYMDPWDQDSYETGSTRPPKSHGGLVAGLLVLVILLCGISSALGVMNFKLSSQLDNSGDSDSPINFYVGETNATGGENATTPAPTYNDSNITIDLSPTPPALDNIPQSGGMSLQDIYSSAIDSVVSISCILSGGTSSGTGVVVAENGYIVTNCHVVEGARSIEVLFTDERILPATVVGTDTISDLAVLYVNASDLSPAQFGDSANLRVGDAVVAIGDPLGLELRGTMTDGIVSAINRDVTVDGRTMTLIQTNAALNSGNSGGPLLNCYGQVIGINTMKISAFADSTGVEGLGFAIPSTTVKEIVDQLIAQGFVSGRPALGLTGQDISVAEQKYWRLPSGVLVSDVTDGSCADNAAIAAGDIILQFNGTRIENCEDLTAALMACSAGDRVEIVVYRYRTEKQFTVTLTLDESKG